MRNRRLSALALLTGLLALSGRAAAQLDLPGSTCRVPGMKPGEPPIDEHLIYFDHGSAELPKREGVDIVLRSAVCWTHQGAAIVGVRAHSDTSGDAAYNLHLSERRGRAVAAELVRRGVKPSLISVEAWGETRPLAATGDGVSEPLNRLVAIEPRIVTPK